MPSVLLFGASGLIGSRLAVSIKKAHPDWPLTVFFRNESYDEYFKSTAGVDKIVHGSFSDTETVRKLSKEHDIVINAASSTDGDLVKTIISGMEERPETAKGTLLHLSGTGNFIDFGTSGQFNEESKVWNDNNEEDIKLIQESMFNGATEVPILEAGQRGKIVTYIIVMGITYGQNIGPSPSAGVAYSLLGGNAKQLGYVPLVGDGSNVLSTIHVEDAIPFVNKILTIAGTEKPQGTAFSRYYIIHNERVAWKDIAVVLAKALYPKGLVASPEPKQVPFEEAGQGGIQYLISSNMLVRGDRAEKLGFKATSPSILVELPKDLASFS